MYICFFELRFLPDFELVLNFLLCLFEQKFKYLDITYQSYSKTTNINIFKQKSTNHNPSNHYVCKEIKESHLMFLKFRFVSIRILISILWNSANIGRTLLPFTSLASHGWVTSQTASLWESASKTYLRTSLICI